MSCDQTKPIQRNFIARDIIQLFIESYNSLYQQFCWLLGVICRYIPLKQWAFDDSHSPKYQKFKTDELPVIKPFCFLGRGYAAKVT